MVGRFEMLKCCKIYSLVNADSCIFSEHINIILLDLSQRYHELLSSVEITDENMRETMESATSCGKGRDYLSTR